MKILFLKMRNPPNHAFIKIIQMIFKADPYTELLKSIIKRYRTSFSDYRYTFKTSLSTLVQEFQGRAERLILIFIIIQYFIYYLKTINFASSLFKEIIWKIEEYRKKTLTVSFHARSSSREF